MMTDPGRLLTAMVTPFDSKGNVDYELAQKLALKIIEDGSDGVVLHGTTGESPTLTHEEEFQLYQEVKKVIAGKGSLIAGTGSNSTKTAIWATKKAEEVGVDGAMIVAPYYNKPSQEGLYQHFKAVAESTSLPLIIYNIPGRTGINMTPETIAKLSKIKNFVGVKEATGDLNQASKIRVLTDKEFKIWSGDDSLTLPILSIGGHGIISVSAHLVGRKMKTMIKAYLEGNVTEAASLHQELMPIFKGLFITSNPTPVKAALAMIGFSVGGPRLPLVGVTEVEKEELKNILKGLKLL